MNSHQTSNMVYFLYHSVCFDGFGSYLYFKQFADNYPFNPGPSEIIYKDVGYDPKSKEFLNNPASFINGSLVIFADYCPSAEVLERLKKLQDCTVLVLDHHATAKDICASFLDFPVDQAVPNNAQLLKLYQNSSPEIYKVFDMNRSGAGIVYDFFWDFFPTKRDALVNYLEDRDLWKFSLPNSKKINAYIQSSKFDFEEWQKLAASLNTEAGLHEATLIGTSILKETEHTVQTILKNSMRISPVTFDSIKTQYRVAFFNTTSHWSEVADAVLTQTDADLSLGMTWNFQNQTVQFSIRSRAGSSVDVSLIAKELGGGGHKTAAGVILTMKTAHAWLVKVGAMDEV